MHRSRRNDRGRRRRDTRLAGAGSPATTDSLQIVDGVEFDRRLRELDVADDVAFLVFDLTAQGGERFGKVLVQAYRDAGGDPGENSLIAFYAA